MPIPWQRAVRVEPCQSRKLALRTTGWALELLVRSPRMLMEAGLAMREASRWDYLLADKSTRMSSLSFRAKTD